MSDLQHKNQRGFAVVEVIVLVIIVALVLGGLWYINYASKNNKSHINDAIQHSGAGGSTSQKSSQ